MKPRQKVTFGGRNLVSWNTMDCLVGNVNTPPKFKMSLIEPQNFPQLSIIYPNKEYQKKCQPFNTAIRFELFNTAVCVWKVWRIPHKTTVVILKFSYRAISLFVLLQRIILCMIAVATSVCLISDIDFCLLLDWILASLILQTSES